MIKKLSLVFAIVLCLSLISSPSFAESEDGYFHIDIGEANGKIGGEVSVDISISNNPGIIGISCKLIYDENVLKLKKVVDGGILGTEIKHQDSLSSPYKLLWANYTTDQETKAAFDEDGTLCTLVFEISGGNEGDEIPLSIELDEEYSVMDFDLNDIPAKTSAGKITITGTSHRNLIIPLISVSSAFAATAIAALFILRMRKKSQNDNDIKD